MLGWGSQKLGIFGQPLTQVDFPPAGDK